MKQGEPGFRALRFQFELDDRIHAFWPVASSPSLNNALIRYEFDVPARDHTAETRKNATRITADLRRRAAAEFAELLGIQQRVVNALRTRLKGNFLLYRVGHGFLLV